MTACPEQISSSLTREKGRHVINEQGEREGGRE
jgi:hypothetical protein